ncbi:MAG: hypothetical protein ACKVU4_08720 [Phycisphaerales bacterium]
MGAWGPGLFSDDIACDVREDWKVLYAGLSPSQAVTAEILEKWQAILDDEDIGSVVWLALAAMQWRYGCLSAEVHQRAVDIIDTGKGLGPWRAESPALLRSRTAVYRKLKDQLQSPQPALKRVRRVPLEHTTLRPGQLIRFILDPGDFALLWVRSLYKYRGAIVPDVVIFNWRGQAIPAPDQLLQLAPHLRSDQDSLIDFNIMMDRTRGLPEETISEHERLARSAGYTRYFIVGSHERTYPASRVAVCEGDYAWPLGEQPEGPTLLRWEELSRELETMITAR